MGPTRILYFLFIVFVQVSGLPCKRKDNIFQKNIIYHTHDPLQRPDLSIQQHGPFLSRLLHRAGFYRNESPVILNSYDGSSQVYQNSVNRINNFDRTVVETANRIENDNSWWLLKKKAFLLGMNDRFKNILHKNTFPVEHFHTFGWHSTHHGIPYDTHNEDHIVVKKPAVFPQVMSTLLKKEDSEVTHVGVKSDYDSATEKIDKINTNVQFQYSTVSLDSGTNNPITENSPGTSNANESITEAPQTYSRNDTMTSLNPVVTNLPENDVSEFTNTTFNSLSTEMLTTENLLTENVDSCSSEITYTLMTVFYENIETTEPTVMYSRPEITTQRTATAFTTTAITESSDDISIEEKTEKSETTQFVTDDFVVDQSLGLVMPLATTQYISEAITTTAPTPVDVVEVIDGVSTLSGILSVVDTDSETTSHVSTIDGDEVATETSSTVDSNVATEFLVTETTTGISITTDLTSDVSSTVLFDDTYDLNTENVPMESYSDENYLVQLIPQVIDGLKNNFISANEKKALSRLYRKLWPYLVEESKRKKDEPMNELLANFLESSGLLGQEENRNWRVKRENYLNIFHDIRESQGSGDAQTVENPIIKEVVSNSIENDGPIELTNVEDYLDEDYSDYSQYDDDHEDDNGQQNDNENDHRYHDDDDFDDDDAFTEKSYLTIFKDDDGMDLLELQ